MDRSSLRWRKSSKSGGGHGCVEVAVAGGTANPGQLMVRDSKDPHGPVLELRERDWDALLARIKKGESI